jgi:hypothetical protein
MAGESFWPCAQNINPGHLGGIPGGFRIGDSLVSSPSYRLYTLPHSAIDTCNSDGRLPRERLAALSNPNGLFSTSGNTGLYHFVNKCCRYASCSRKPPLLAKEPFELWGEKSAIAIWLEKSNSHDKHSVVDNSHRHARWNYCKLTEPSIVYWHLGDIVSSHMKETLLCGISRR